MEQYIILCLDCHEIFPGGRHTCKTPEVHLIANSDSAYKQQARFDGVTASESYVYGNGTHYLSEVPTNLEETFSDQMRETTKTTCEMYTGNNVDFSSSPRTPSLQRQSESSRDGSFVLEAELKPISSVKPLIQDDGYDHWTTRVPPNFQRMSDDSSIDNNLSSTSLGNLGATAGPSTDWNLLGDCEPLDVEAHRRPEDRRYVCPFCGKITGRKLHFLDHVRTHTGERPFPCDICGKKYKTSNALKVHRRSHTGEKPYGCIICGKYFSRASSRSNHYKIVHKCNGSHVLKNDAIIDESMDIPA